MELRRDSPEVRTAIRKRKGFNEAWIVLLVTFAALLTISFLRTVLFDKKSGIISDPSNASSTWLLFSILLVLVWSPAVIAVMLSWRLRRILAEGILVPASRKDERFAYEFAGELHLVEDAVSMQDENKDKIAIAFVDPKSPARAVIVLISPPTTAAGVFRKIVGLFRRKS